VGSLPEKRFAGEAAVAAVVNVPKKGKKKIKCSRKYHKNARKRQHLLEQPERHKLDMN
jgi:hypothetical protein